MGSRFVGVRDRWQPMKSEAISAAFVVTGVVTVRLIARNLLIAKMVDNTGLEPVIRFSLRHKSLFIRRLSHANTSNRPRPLLRWL